jgi:ABC-type nitrate/sulfonate/bicarbonate transport system permease component
VLAVDAVAIAGYFVAHVGRAAPRTRLAFTIAWMVATLVVVLVGLSRIRRARLDALNRR